MSSVIFSDEATYYVNGTVSTHQFRTWAKTNPHKVIQKQRFTQKVTVWFGYSQKLKIPPFFFNGNVTGDNYRSLLLSHVKPFLTKRHKLRCNMFQQDGATAHTASETLDTCRKIFKDKLISLHTEFEWPANSPDLSPLDYFLWNEVKTKVYSQPIQDVNQMKELILSAIANIEQQTLSNSIENIKYRLSRCVSAKGSHFEQCF